MESPNYFSTILVCSSGIILVSRLSITVMFGCSNIGRIGLGVGRIICVYAETHPQQWPPAPQRAGPPPGQTNVRFFGQGKRAGNFHKKLKVLKALSCSVGRTGRGGRARLAALPAAGWEGMCRNATMLQTKFKNSDVKIWCLVVRTVYLC